MNFIQRSLIDQSLYMFLPTASAVEVTKFVMSVHMIPILSLGSSTLSEKNVKMKRNRHIHWLNSHGNANSTFLFHWNLSDRDSLFWWDDLLGRAFFFHILKYSGKNVPKVELISVVMFQELLMLRGPQHQVSAECRGKKIEILPCLLIAFLLQLHGNSLQRLS